MKFMLIIAMIVLAQAQSETKFSAQVEIHQDVTPGDAVKNVLKATLNYDFGSKMTSFSYSKPGDPLVDGYREVFDYNTKIQYKESCSPCVALKTGEMPIFHPEASDVQQGGAPLTMPPGDGRTCLRFTKNPATSGGVSAIWVNVPNPTMPTSGRTTCKVDFADGKEIIFGRPSSTSFGAFSHKSCTPKCGAPLDLTFVIDESGSINPTEWEQMKTFVKGVIDRFTVGPNQTHVGVAYFSGVTFSPTQDPANCCGLADPALPFSASRANIDAVIDIHTKKGGHTCITCGMRAAMDFYPNPLRSGNNRQVMIVITDGYNNRRNNFWLRDIDLVRNHNGGITTYAVGVTNSDDTQLLQIAGGVASRVFRAADFTALVADIQKISDAVCEDFLDQTPCGPLCKGICPCGTTCACPSECIGAGTCETGVCDSPLVGCRAKINDCAPTPGVCPDATTCKTRVCTANGPQNIESCTEQDIPGCEVAVCASCTQEALANPCKCPVCGPNGCTSEDKVCDDNNACTIDRCDILTGECKSDEQVVCTNANNDVCVNFRCDPVRGCLEDTYDCSAVPARNKCTIVVCEASTDMEGKRVPACVQKPIAPGLVDACGNCKSDRLPCNKGGSSAIAVSGVATALVIVAALAGGAFAVGIGACLAAGASGGAGSASAAPSAAASVNPLYEADPNVFDNPLAN